MLWNTIEFPSQNQQGIVSIMQGRSLTPDDYRVGQWLVMVHAHNTLPNTENITLPMVIKPELPHGTPVKLLAIDLPWIIGWNGHNVSTIDSRRYSFQKTTRHYVNCWIKHTLGNHHPPMSRPVTTDDIQEAQNRVEAFTRHDLTDVNVDLDVIHPSDVQKFIQSMGPEKFTPAETACPACGTPMLIACNIRSGERFSLCPKCGTQGDPVERT